MDLLRDSNGRSSSEPDGTYVKVLLFKAYNACELTYLEIEAVCKVDVVCSIHPSMKFRVQSSRDAEITNLKG